MSSGIYSGKSYRKNTGLSFNFLLMRVSLKEDFSKEDFLKEVVQLYVLYFSTVIAVYFLPSIIKLVFFIFLLIFFYRSKKDYFWLAFVFIAESQPGSLFIITDSSHTFSLLQNTPLGYLFFWMVFILVAFVKSYKFKAKYPFFLKGPVIALLIYIVILLLIFGIHKLNFFGGLLPWLLLFILPRFFKKEEDYERFFYLIFAFVFLVVFYQITFILTGKELNVFLGGEARGSILNKSINEVGQALRPEAGIYIPFFSVIGSTILLTYRKTKISRNYLYIILVVSIFSIFITATRGWMLAAMLVFFVFLYFGSKNPFALVQKFFIPAILLILMFSFVPSLQRQSNMVIARLETLTNLAEGDVTAGGTLSRINERGPRVMKKFWESPILGFGFSSEAVPYSDGHVGNQNLLLHAGILGYSIYVIIWLLFFMKMYLREKGLSSENEYKHLPMMMIASFMSLILIHSSSSQWFGLGFGYIRGFIFFFILTYGNFIYWDSYKERTEKSAI